MDTRLHSPDVIARVHYHRDHSSIHHLNEDLHVSWSSGNTAFSCRTALFQFVLAQTYRKVIFKISLCTAFVSYSLVDYVGSDVGPRLKLLQSSLRFKETNKEKIRQVPNYNKIFKMPLIFIICWALTCLRWYQVLKRVLKTAKNVWVLRANKTVQSYQIIP